MHVRVRVVVLLLAAAALTLSVAAGADELKSTKAKPHTTHAATHAARPAAKAAGKSAGASDAAIASIDAQIAKLAVNKTDPMWRTKLKVPTVAKFDPAKSYLAHMTTNKGTMTIKFRPDVAPMHVTNFIYLSRLGFYDGLKFHRVIKGFMAQGGDPLGNGAGGPGYQIALEVSEKAKHDAPGVVSTANSGPNTDGSQFFIMFQPYPSLDMSYSVFGKVIEGMDTLQKLEAAANPGNGLPGDPPTEPLTIEKVTIEVK